MHTFYLFILFAFHWRPFLCEEWCYASQNSCEYKCHGPDKWADVISICGGIHQSPINIVTRRISAKSSLTPLEFRGYQDTFHSVITNNGHTVKVNLSGTSMINGGDLEASYKAIEFHFHWGKNGGPGSEHTIDGERYPMEMHIVHIKENYISVEEAVKDQSGVAVLGLLYKESESLNKNYGSIINALEDIKHPGNRSVIETLSLDMLMPHNMPKNYFRYVGSLTTPNCTESVIWTVFENPVLLNKQQLSAFSSLRFDRGEAMVDTFRPVQPLNGREVFYSGASVISVSIVLVVSFVLTSILALWE